MAPNLPTSTISMITSPEVMGISQDSLGCRGVAVGRHGHLQVWVKPLADGSKAVAILNRGSAVGSIRITASMIGLRRQHLTVRDVWEHHSSYVSAIQATLGGDSADLLRVSG